MTDPEQLAVLGGSAALVAKVLGPTAEYLGDELQQWTQRRVTNVQRIFASAEKRLGDRINDSGTVPPRMLREVLDEGSYWDDPLGAEYFGGLLAASRTNLATDDRAATLAALVGRLSTFQLRTHYVMYGHAHEFLAGTDIDIRLGEERTKARIFIPHSTWLVALGAGEDSTETDWNAVLQHSVFGLQREDLLSLEMSGNPEFLTKQLSRTVEAGGTIFALTLLGIELFCMAHGIDSPYESFMNPATAFSSDAEIPVMAGAQLVSELPSAAEAAS